MLLPHFEVFVDEKIGQFASHLLRQVRVTRGKRHVERSDLIRPDIFDQIDIDILAHHLDFFVGRALRVLRRIKIELIDNVQKPRPAENLLRNALQPHLQVLVDVRRHVVLGHGRLLHQNQRARLVTRRQHPARAPHQHPSQKQRNQEMDVPAAH